MAFTDACQQAGHPLREDFNGGELDGAGLHDMTITDGHRQTTADAYLRPVLSRQNLAVKLGACVRRLVVEGSRCAGVEYYRDGRLERVRADAGMVLCAGAIDSPRLLMLSGTGHPQELSGLGIDTVADVPGVDRNLHDHILLCGGICVEARQPIPAGTGNLARRSCTGAATTPCPGPTCRWS